MNDTGRIVLSVAAPACNEEEVIEGVVTSWIDALKAWGIPFEIVITDDGSADRTGEILDELARRHAQLRVISFDRNRGYGPAIGAAIAATRGEVVATMDSDGQFDIADVRALVDLMERGKLDGVTGFRRGKKDALLKVAADRVLNLLVNRICGLRFKDNNCALKVVRGAAVRRLRLNTRWLTPSEILVRLSWEGRRMAQVGVRHRPRPGGRSKIHVIVAQCLRLVLVMLHLRMERYLKRHGMLFDRDELDAGTRGDAGDGDRGRIAS